MAHKRAVVQRYAEAAQPFANINHAARPSDAYLQRYAHLNHLSRSLATPTLPVPLPAPCVSCPLRVQLAEARAERRADQKVHAVELQASQDSIDQLVQAGNRISRAKLVQAEQLAEARAERRADQIVHAIELQASQDRIDELVQAGNKISSAQLVQAENRLSRAPKYFSQIVQLFIIMLLCLIFFKLGCSSGDLPSAV